MGWRGFTLVELLVTLAIGAILLAIAIPGYAFLINASRLTAVTNDLVSALHLARSEAIKRGMRVTVCKTSNATAATPACDTTASWQQGWLVFADGGTRGVIDSGDTLLWVQDRAPPAVNHHKQQLRPIYQLPAKWKKPGIKWTGQWHDTNLCGRYSTRHHHQHHRASPARFRNLLIGAHQTQVGDIYDVIASGMGSDDEARLDWSFSRS